MNPEQKKAVEQYRKPLLIVAGAGTGKTFVIVEKIKSLLAKKKAKPEEILALTFTEKAAQEMETRVDIALSYGIFGIWISTFHSFCDRILRSEALHIGLSPGFKLMTGAENFLFIKQNFWRFKLKYFRPGGNPYKFIEGLIQHFERLKDEDIGYEDYLAFVKRQTAYKKNRLPKEELNKLSELANAYKTYEWLKINQGVMDFSDLIGQTLKLFRQRKTILNYYRKQFKYMLVDEFQDTNLAQYQLIKLLAPPKSLPNLTVVGDDSQSIYKFRGAAISNILSFMKDYPGSKRIVLTKNYRSPQMILDAAYRLIKENDPNTLEARLGISKKLVSYNNNRGTEIDFIYSDQAENEAEKVTKFIIDYKARLNRRFKDFAIMVRANSHSEPFIRSLERARIPFQFLGPGMLFRQPEVKDLIAYLKVLYDFTDTVSLYRILSMAIWDISARDLIAVLNLGKKAHLSLFEQLENLDEVKNISDRSREIFKKFTDMVHRHQKKIPHETAGQIMYYFLEDSGLLKEIVSYKTQSDEKKALNITRFFDKLKSFEATHKDAGVFSVVDYLELAMDMGESPLAAETDWTENDAVNILTIHSSKGLEFPVVFLVNLIEGRFPVRENKEKIPIPDNLIKEILPIGDFHTQEERRLFYVGMTRSQEKLVYSASDFYAEGKRKSRLSPFIRESLGGKFDLTKSTDQLQSQIPLFEWKKSREAEITRPVIKNKVDFLSYSAIEAFRTCPLHYKLSQILKIPTPPTASLSLGSSIHLVMKEFYSLKINKKIKTGDEKLQLFKLLKDLWIPEGYINRKHEADFFRKGKKFLSDYLLSDLHKSANPVFLERPFVFKLGTDLKITGKIDRVDDLGNGKLEIIDYKTGSKIPAQKDIDKNLQMTIYSLAATNPAIFNKDLERIKMSFYFFEKGLKISTTRTAPELEEAADKILKIKAEIESSDLVCSRSRYCLNCSYKILCNG